MGLALGWLDGALALLSSAILTVAFLGAIAAAFRDTIGGWLTIKTKHYYDAELENVRSTNARAIEEIKAHFAHELEYLKSELSAKSKEVEALRAASLGARAARQALLDKRRLEAVDQIWSTIKELASGKLAVNMLPFLRDNPWAMESTTNPYIAELLKSLAIKPLVDGNLENQAHGARPYVSPTAWGLFSVYASVIAMVKLNIAFLNSGLPPTAINHDREIMDLLIAAAPTHQSYIESNRVKSYALVIEEIEKQLLVELQRSLRGEDNDRDEVERAANIMGMVRDVSLNWTKALTPRDTAGDT